MQDKLIGSENSIIFYEDKGYISLMDEMYKKYLEFYIFILT